MSTVKTIIALSLLSLVFIIILSRYRLLTISDELRSPTNRSVSPAQKNTAMCVNQTIDMTIRTTTAAIRTFQKTSASSKQKKVGVAQAERCGHFQFEYVINCVDCCASKHSTVLLFIYVHSAITNFARRARIRASWALRSNYPDDRVETVFFVGLPTDSRRLATQSTIEAESRQFGDIVQVNVVDSYRNMTLKALAALSWIAKHCSDAKYFIKADDDAFVNGFAVLKHLRDLQQAGYTRDLLLCLVCYRPPVARTGKWAVSRAEFAPSRYPTYCYGIGYVITADVIALILSAAAGCHRIHRRLDVSLPGNPHLHNDVTDVPVIYSEDSRNDVTLPPPRGVTDSGHYGRVLDHDDVTGATSPKHDVTFERRFWIDDVYVTGLLVEALADRIRHGNMSAAYCKWDKMAAVYRHVTEWYKYVFTEVGDDQGNLYSETWNALRQRAANSTIPTPSVIKPGHLADHYIPLSLMLQLARNITQTAV